MRRVIILMSLLFGAVLPAVAQVSMGIGLPSLSIGINFPIYPQFQPVPGYPVYYAPQVDANYFFYDGMFWVYQSDYWYASSWYNGPWAMVSPVVVPVFILLVPVSYYRQPPIYFRGWRQDAPPRWDDHWGNDWQRQRSGWNHWNRNSVPAAAPLPTYQQKYSGSRYPSVEQQRAIVSQNYHYQPRDPVVQRHYQQFVVPKAPVPSQQVQPHRQSQQYQQQPSGQDRPPGQGENTSRQPPHPPPQQSSGQDRPPGQAENTYRQPPHQPQQQPSGQDRPPGQAEDTYRQPPHQPQQQPSGQDRPPGQAEDTYRQPPHQSQQQPSGQERGSPGQAENAPRPPMQDQGKDQSTDKGQNKERQRDNR